LSSSPTERGAATPRFTERGVALIAALAAVLLLGAVVTEFSAESYVSYEAARNAQDDMRAQFLARSGMNLSRLIIKVQGDLLDRYRQYIGDLQLADFAPLFIGAFGGNREDVAMIGEALGGIDGSALKGLGVAEGEFDLQVSTDDGKININCANGGLETRNRVFTQLAAMVYPEAYDRLFEEEDGEGWRRDRETQVAAIVDYIDGDNARAQPPGESAAAVPEDYGYELVRDGYKPKNNYIDSVGELQLVRGVDDRFWTLFGDAFTAYGPCQVNLAAATDVNLLASIIYVSASQEELQGPVLRDPNKLWALAQFVATATKMGMQFTELKDFAEFVGDPAGALRDLLGADPAAGGQAAGAGIVFPDGVKLDVDKLQQVATVGPRRVYRVEAVGRIGRVEKRIVGVWDTAAQRQSARPQAMGRGAWVFWREE
jgi:general secretion pathway protein K